MNYQRNIAILRRQADALHARYADLAFKLADVADKLENLLDDMPLDDPRGRAVDEALSALIDTTRDNDDLHWDVIALLERHLEQNISAKQAYERGWSDQIKELGARATPDQSAMLSDLLNEQPDDLPF